MKSDKRPPVLQISFAVFHQQVLPAPNAKIDIAALFVDLNQLKAWSSGHLGQPRKFHLFLPKWVQKQPLSYTPRTAPLDAKFSAKLNAWDINQVRGAQGTQESKEQDEVGETLFGGLFVGTTSE